MVAKQKLANLHQKACVIFKKLFILRYNKKKPIELEKNLKVAIKSGSNLR